MRSYRHEQIQLDEDDCILLKQICDKIENLRIYSRILDAYSMDGIYCHFEPVPSNVLWKYYVLHAPMGSHLQYHPGESSYMLTVYLTPHKFYIIKSKKGGTL